MPLDSSIILGIRPVETPDTLGQIGKALAIKGAIGQQQLQAVSLEQAQREQRNAQTYDQAAKESGGDLGVMSRRLLELGNADAAIKTSVAHTKSLKDAADLQESQGKVIAQRMKEFQDSMADVKTPEDARQHTIAMHADPVLGPALARQGNTVDQSLARIPTDPAQFQQYVAMKSMGMGKYLEANKPTTFNQDTGSTVTTYQRPGLGGPATPIMASPKTATPGEILTDKRQRELYGSFSGAPGDLLAALAEKGVSIPAGLRSRAQIQATLGGLITRNPGKSADQIAEMVRSGQISLAAEKKETATAAATAGRVGVAGEEIEQFAPLVEQASKEVSRGQFMPITKLLQTAESQINDPKLKTLRIQINGLLNAYDQLAARGGTDKDKRAEAHDLITKADSHEALMAGLKAFKQEMVAARNAAAIASAPKSERDALRAKLTGKSEQPGEAPKPQQFDQLPDPAQHSGKTMTDTSTNTKYRSDGKRWVRI